MSSRSVGSKWVKELESLFKSWGFTTWRPGSRAFFIAPGKVVSQSQDIFECFDLEATSSWLHVYAQSKGDFKTKSHPSKARLLIDKLPMPEGTCRLVTSRVPKKPMHFLAWVRFYTEWTGPFNLSPKEVPEWARGKPAGPKP